MEFTVKYNKDDAILRLSGDILGDDRIKLNEKIQELADGGSKGIVLNLKGVGLMDSVGLGMLVACYTSLIRRQIRLVLSDVGTSVKYLLTITKLDRVFEVYDTEDDALTHLQS
jgi:anti-sigma B factor antagonist